MRKLLIVAFSAAALLTAVARAQSFDYKKMEQISKAATVKAYQSSVRIWGFDTAKQQQASAQFSGVVVSAEGHILTVAHAVVPGKVYKVFFTDGSERLATALGRIGFKDKQNMPDVAMMKLMGEGKWPYAELGWSGSLKENEPCISISYPETLNQKQPSVRFGRISEPMNKWGFVVSTCKMEPGDSGGPLYDYLGRVVALHSRIDISESVNLEVPVDLYRKYWTALQKPEDYAELPAEADEVASDPMKDKLMAMPGLADMESHSGKINLKHGDGAVKVESKLKGNPVSVSGTLFLFKLKGKAEYLLVSKSSLVGAEPGLVLYGGKHAGLEVIKRDADNDLVLMRLKPDPENGAIRMLLKEALSFNPADTAAVTTADLGRFLISPVAPGDKRTSVLSSTNFSLPRKFSAGFFGAGANFINEEIILTRMAPGGPAEEAKLKLGDRIIGINGVPISRPEHYGQELIKYNPGDTISIQGMRNGERYELMVGLRKMPGQGDHPAERFAGGKSLRLDGFSSVFSHDALIRPEECGGPVFDLSGDFNGINIARFSRTSTLVMPRAVIYRFIAAAI
ncbi:trypsin-like peptidase domain-containing protein [Pedobacter sp. JY14-1]|uniref:trypsin-like peptidase domain-containing protein n=1 Tax=Pedobacter sp. JY14-1 TaxID=3034151 RepID=UPI0023E11963|nr:trypsin-like peptidase domain-containing protein [Pedobacter sp. JY14-1]